MKWPATFALCLLFPVLAQAQAHGETLKATVNTYILPEYAAFADRSEALKQAAQSDCNASSKPLRAAYHAAFDQWLRVSHLRFGPSEVEDRAFALAFWPDTKGFTPKSLGKLITSRDATGTNAQAYREVSIAARGFYALEFLLFDARISTLGDAAYRCALTRTITADIDANADAILSDWRADYAAKMIQPGQNASPYRTEKEAVQELFKALITGLEFTKDARLGRPLGSFDRPRPRRAETYRSGRSLRNVVQVVTSLRELARLLAAGEPNLAKTLDAGFARSLEIAAELDDPVFAGVATPGGRLRVEILQQSIDHIHELALNELGAKLGVRAGFNALDGD